MKVFFTGSPRAMKTFKEEHLTIYKTIEDLGHTNVSNLIIKANPDNFYKAGHEQIVENYKKTLEDLSEADVLVVELSTHSMSMGFLINKALELGKPVIALYTKGHDPFFFSGMNNDKFQMSDYSIENLKDVLSDALQYAQNISDTRFNFLISPSLLEYLDWVAKNRRIPRSVYLRRLIEADRDKNKDYLK